MELRIDQLTCQRAGKTVFTGLNAGVKAGQALVLAGRNGAGKSSLLRLLAGLIAPQSGDATLGTVSLTRDRSAFQERVLYCGHLDALKPAFTACETLRFWATLYHAEKSGVDAALDALGLSRLRDHPVRILSAGQKRRLGLARLALIDRPVWLLDEPTVSLDSEASRRIAELARRRCETGGIVVAASHIDFDIAATQTLDPSDYVPTAASGFGADDAVLAGDAW